MSNPTSDDRTPIKTALQAHLTDLEAASYKRTVRTSVNDFIEQTDVRFVEETSSQTVREYARTLKSRDIATSTAEKYYSNVRSWLEWCVEEELIPTNPAKSSRASAPLPETEDDSEQQFWAIEDRNHLLNGLDRQLDHALDGKIDVDPYLANRDQILFYVIALTAVRGAEVLDEPDEDHPLRQGLRWRTVNLDRNSMQVLGKTRENEKVGLMPDVASRLERWRQRLDPPSGDWPVFPVLSASALAQMMGEQLDDAGYTTDDDTHVIAFAREHGLTVPSISPQSARKRLRKYSERWDLPTDGTEPHLQLHGARRRLGDELYMEEAELSQDILRHKSIETTHRNYRQEKAEERAVDAAEAIGRGGEGGNS